MTVETWPTNDLTQIVSLIDTDRTSVITSRHVGADRELNSMKVTTTSVGGSCLHGDEDEAERHTVAAEEDLTHFSLCPEGGRGATPNNTVQ